MQPKSKSLTKKAGRRQTRLTRFIEDNKDKINISDSEEDYPIVIGSNLYNHHMNLVEATPEELEEGNRS